MPMSVIVQPERTVVGARDARPAPVRAIVTITALMVYRAGVAAFLPRLGDDDTSWAWIVPWVGDTLIGLTAPIVAYLLWTRRGALIWGLGLAWTFWGAWDYLSGIMVNIVEPLEDGFGPEWFTYLWLIGWMLAQIYVLWRLTHTDIARYYLATETDPEAR